MLDTILNDIKFKETKQNKYMNRF